MDEKLNKLATDMEEIKKLITILNDNVNNLQDKVDHLDNKVHEEVLEECKKMGSHIDFVENVYDTVKHPLGYICKKIKTYTGSGSEPEPQYTLIDIDE